MLHRSVLARRAIPHCRHVAVFAFLDWCHAIQLSLYSSSGMSNSSDYLNPRQDSTAQQHWHEIWHHVGILPKFSKVIWLLHRLNPCQSVSMVGVSCPHPSTHYSKIQTAANSSCNAPLRCCVLACFYILLRQRRYRCCCYGKVKP